MINKLRFRNGMKDISGQREAFDIVKRNKRSIRYYLHPDMINKLEREIDRRKLECWS